MGEAREILDMLKDSRKKERGKVNNLPTSFSEMMALPDSQLSTSFWLP